MSPDDMDEVDLALLDVIAILKFYRVSLDQGLSVVTERMTQLWPEIEPRPTHTAPHAIQ